MLREAFRYKTFVANGEHSARQQAQPGTLLHGLSERLRLFLTRSSRSTGPYIFLPSCKNGHESGLVLANIIYGDFWVLNETTAKPFSVCVVRSRAIAKAGGRPDY